MFNFFAARHTGNAQYPPLEKTTSACISVNIFLHSATHLCNLYGINKFFGVGERMNAGGEILYISAFCLLISSVSIAFPEEKYTILSQVFSRWGISETKGITCPAVPPPHKTIVFILYIMFINSIFLSRAEKHIKNFHI